MCILLTPPPIPTIRWLHGLIDTYGGVQPDTDEVHIPVGKKSDIRANMMKKYEVGMSTDLIEVSGKQFNKV